MKKKKGFGPTAIAVTIIAIVVLVVVALGLFLGGDVAKSWINWFKEILRFRR
jgi:hypothetical protein